MKELWAIHYTILKAKPQKTFNISSQSFSTGLIRYDTGLVEINNYI